MEKQKRYTFEEYCFNKGINTSRFTVSFLNKIKKIYNNFTHFKLAPFLSSSRTEEDIYLLINNELRKSYNIRYHNIGKGALKKYYAYNDVPAWLKVLHYLVAHFYSIKKSETNIKNKTIAINIGWLSEQETDPEVIAKALRKVTDTLNILKNDFKLISVQQLYTYGKKGSRHVITADWVEIISLLSQYDDKSEGSIRFRKSIKYRIISLLRNKNNIDKALNKLLERQKYSYLVNLVEFDLDEFQNNKYILFKILKDFKWLGIPKTWYTTDYIVPIFNKEQTSLVLEAKNEYIYKELTCLNNRLSLIFKENYNINLSVVANW